MINQPPQKRISEERNEAPAIWRGLGFLLILLIPVLAIASSIVFIETAIEKKWPVYWPLVGRMPAPDWVWGVPGLNTLMAKLVSIPNMLGYIVFSLIFLVILYTLLSIFYAFVYRTLGVGRYTVVDVKRPSVKVKRYRR